MAFEKITNPPAKPERTPDNMRYDAFLEFLTSENNFSADQIQSAYEAFLEKREPEDPDEKRIAAEMERLSQEGFPLNRFVTIIQGLHEIDSRTPKLTKYIENLPISEKEKTILRSVALMKRRGILEFAADGKDFAKIDLNEINEDEYEEVLLQALEEVMKVGKNAKKLEIVHVS